MESQVRSLTNFLGESPFPYIAMGAILLLLGIGGLVTTVGKEMKKKDETHAKRVVSLSSSGLIVAMGMSALGFVILAIGLTKLI
ncbi:MAG: hypothetical protein GX291_03335 [Tissierellia bacterium]|nr:hypothetical protein [Bacillota bacterium]NLK58291.1 hypothetical protein [Tissierellia bacterium]